MKTDLDTILTIDRTSLTAFIFDVPIYNNKSIFKVNPEQIGAVLEENNINKNTLLAMRQKLQTATPEYPTIMEQLESIEKTFKI